MSRLLTVVCCYLCGIMTCTISPVWTWKQSSPVKSTNTEWCHLLDTRNTNIRHVEVHVYCEHTCKTEKETTLISFLISEFLTFSHDFSPYLRRRSQLQLPFQTQMFVVGIIRQLFIPELWFSFQNSTFPSFDFKLLYPIFWFFLNID